MEAEIVRHLDVYSTALGQGDRTTALRNIDRVERLTRANPEIKLLYGGLLLAEGEFSRAIPLLEFAATRRPTQHTEGALIRALWGSGQREAAVARLDSALRRFAIGPTHGLAATARQIVRELRSGYSGWVGISPELQLCGDLVGGVGVSHVEWLRAEDPSLHLERVTFDAEGAAPFQMDCGNTGRSSELFITSGGIELLGGLGLRFPPDFDLDGRATIADGAIVGWASLGWNPDQSPLLRIVGTDGFDLKIGATADPGHLGRHTFRVEPETWRAAGNELRILVFLPDGTWRALPDTPLIVEPAAYPPLRARRSKSTAARRNRIVDIVIPAYKGLADTLACIKSVARTTKGRAEIVVVDDASPEPALSPALDRLAAAGVITLVRNRRNLGFPRSVNRGMALHRNRDVVILNSDVEVFAGWFDRLRTAAYRDDRIGTVTPLTNSGTIASYPRSEDSDCDRKTAASLHRATSRINAGIAVDVPTAVGFCMYIKRDCLAQTGYFDPVTFGKGYGEENDFCLRAATAGWRHVLATDVFVLHLGGKSFGSAKAALTDRNLRLINLRFPDYDSRIAEFAAQDPAHPARRRLDEARLASARRRHVLLVTLALEGGVRRAVNDRVASLQRDGLTPITLKPDADDTSRCVLSVEGMRFEDLHYRFEDETAALLTLLRRLRLESIELHHCLGLPGSLIDSLYQLGAPVDIGVHDYVWYCPRLALAEDSKPYCGEPDLAGCEACIERNGSLLTEDISVRELRARSARWFSQARKVAVPSHSVATRIAGRFPGTSPEIEPLETDVDIKRPVETRLARLRVAVIGGINSPKGYEPLLAAAKDAASRDLPIEFVVIGYTQGDGPLIETGKAFVTGYYRDAEIASLIAREQPDIAFFPSVVPETWCYALSHALRAGLPIVAFDLGAIAERVRSAQTKAILLPVSVTASELNNALVETFCVSAALPRAAAALPQTQARPALPAIGREALPIKEPALSRSAMAPNSNGLSATVEILPLVKGLYLFSVQATDPQRIGDDHELTLPALQVTLGPGTPAGHVEFMLGPRTEGAWLCERRDTIVVKVKEPSTIVMLTSIQLPGMTPLEVEVKRLDNTGSSVPRSGRGQAQAAQPAQPPARTALPQQQIPARQQPAPVAAAPAARVFPPPSWHTQRSIRLAIVAHVQNRGDVSFSEGQWAGAVGERLAIESFTITPLETVAPELIEYKAVTATGVETPWVSGGTPCGTRGMGLPLVGLAIRTKPQAGGGFTCEYGATMVSGISIGPSRDGAPCRSPNPADPLEALWVTIVGNGEAEGEALGDDRADQAARTRRSRAAAGPRFSMFRQPAEPAAE